MRRRNGFNKGVLAMTFAIGLLMSCFCPPKILIGVLGIWVIILCLPCCKYK